MIWMLTMFGMISIQILMIFSTTICRSNKLCPTKIIIIICMKLILHGRVYVMQMVSMQLQFVVWYIELCFILICAKNNSIFKFFLKKNKSNVMKVCVCHVLKQCVMKHTILLLQTSLFVTMMKYFVFFFVLFSSFVSKLFFFRFNELRRNCQHRYIASNVASIIVNYALILCTNRVVVEKSIRTNQLAWVWLTWPMVPATICLRR